MDLTLLKSFSWPIYQVRGWRLSRKTSIKSHLLSESTVAVGLCFGRLFRGFGQIGGAIASAVLDRELRKRIHNPNINEVLRRFSFRESSHCLIPLPLDH
ncbi:hypothetical protein BDM02DRAFT_2051219 [Thelephora ganbajun]|uniref:Uncharacterized protein n=1 Tax=Thelephora ganbajun TaxID=370292 RepID=A0ACB6YYT4_THEGA|nr:hypothetical protein BDM02DRAFT_2051219 [Thelephora ganbajun]